MLFLDSKLLDSDFVAELNQYSQKLSSERSSFSALARSYEEFLNDVAISNDEGQVIIKSLKVNDFEPVDSYFEQVKHDISMFQDQYNASQKKLHEVEMQFQKTQQIFKNKEEEAASKKTVVTVFGSALTVLASTAAVLAVGVVTAGIVAPIAAAAAAGTVGAITTAVASIIYSEPEKKFNELYKALASARKNAEELRKTIAELDQSANKVLAWCIKMQSSMFAVL